MRNAASFVRTAGRVIVVVIGMAASTQTARADDLTTTFSGYGTVGGSFTSNSNFAYRHDSSEFNGASNNFDVALESRIGAQATFSYGPNWSVTVQEVARQRGSSDFDPGTEWLYLQYTPEPSVQVRVGRVVLATFLFSESREVGYAVPWFEAPGSVYAAEPFQHLDGGQVIWKAPLEVVHLRLQGSFGTTDVDLQTNGQTFTSTSHDVSNISAELEYENFLVRIAQTKTHTSISLPLSAQFTLVAPVQDKFVSAGFQYDNGQALVLGEWAKRTENRLPVVNESLILETCWYVGAGWRLGKFTPLIEFANNSTQPSVLDPTRASHNTVTAVLRWDVITNIALKAQITREPESGPDWVTADPSSNKRVNIYGIGADFIF